jgi:hypothetical protein
MPSLFYLAGLVALYVCILDRIFAYYQPLLPPILSFRMSQILSQTISLLRVHLNSIGKTSSNTRVASPFYRHISLHEKTLELCCFNP